MHEKRGKGSPYSITERGSGADPGYWQSACRHYFPPGPKLPSQPLRGLLPISLLGEQRHDGYEQFA